MVMDGLWRFCSMILMIGRTTVIYQKPLPLICTIQTVSCDQYVIMYIRLSSLLHNSESVLYNTKSDCLHSAIYNSTHYCPVLIQNRGPNMVFNPQAPEFSFKFQHTLYIKCEQNRKQKRQHYEINGILKRKKTGSMHHV